MREIFLYNTLTANKDLFIPLVPDHVGMYVCGPTVYSDVHLGNCRTFTSFDLLYRFLLYIGYKVRYVRNITDVGHLEGDADIGREDKIEKKARLEHLEPMEIVQRYTNSFHQVMKSLNITDPSIEPTATGHLLEQINMVKEILEAGYAYEMNGSIYFDTLKYAEDTGKYGIVSGRKIEDLKAESRDNLKNQSEKKHPSDFAIWIKAGPAHLMKWDTEWSTGFPGWHLECSAMSSKYLGTTFDIHGGGQDLKFPHHENEIAQNVAACGESGARYWLHTNMLLLNGKKMSKSEGNSILPHELFSGENHLFSSAFTPMEVRFYMLQSHYRSTLDLTDDGLSASAKGFKRIKEAYTQIHSITYINSNENSNTNERLTAILTQMENDLADDLNSPKAIAGLFEVVGIINNILARQASESEINELTRDILLRIFEGFIIGVLGLKLSEADNSMQTQVDNLMNLVLDIRASARENKDWSTSDLIRQKLDKMDIQVKDGKEGATWTFK